jgi:nicotinate-nucleotide pyrophosphorylase (carboxylating)
VATLTSGYVEAVSGLPTRITCTRKTLPGLRIVQKWAVVCGGGFNHRRRLDDAVLIKDNHIDSAGGIGPALQAAKAHAGHLVKIEVEVDTLAQLDEALAHKPDAVLLDNFTLVDLAAGVRRCQATGVFAEASGGVTLETVRAIAETGVNAISVGALTHSAPVLDIGLDVD